MNVRLGWSGDIHGTWTKMDVEVCDADLNQVLSDNDIDPGTAKFSSLERFKLMYSIAETYVQLHKMSRFPDVFGTDTDRSELQELLKAKDRIVRDIKARV